MRILERSLVWATVLSLAAPVPVAAEPAAAVPTRVVVLVESIDAEAVSKFQSKRYAELFRTAIEADPEALEVGGESTARLAGETAAFMFFFSMGFGLIGGTQAAIKESNQVEALWDEARWRFSDQRTERQLDRAFADAVGAALATVPGLQVDGPVELVVRGADAPAPEDDRDATRWVGANHADDPRGVLLVSLRHGAAEDLSGVYGVAKVWWFVPPGAAPGGTVKRGAGSGLRPDYYTHHADGTPRKDPSAGRTGKVQVVLAQAHEHALFTTPVPLADLKEPPASKVAADTAAIKAEFDPLIETTKDRDLRRDLRGQRNRELDKATRWYPVSFAKHMHDAWLAPPGDVYARSMSRAQGDLARRIAEGIAAKR